MSRYFLRRMDETHAGACFTQCISSLGIKITNLFLRGKISLQRFHINDWIILFTNLSD